MSLQEDMHSLLTDLTQVGISGSLSDLQDSDGLFITSSQAEAAQERLESLGYSMTGTRMRNVWYHKPGTRCSLLFEPVGHDYTIYIETL